MMASMNRGRLALCFFVLTTFAAGCSTAPANRSFDVSATDARKMLREMRESPCPLERPVVIIHGLGPPVGSWVLERELKRLTGDHRIVSISYDFTAPFERSRPTVVAAVERELPCDDPEFTREVDVVAISMGGVVARYAAAPPAGAIGKRLKIARLFTISSPHRGAEMAALPALLGRVQRDLREGSPFLRDLARREAERPPYQLVPYARLGDRIVGVHNTAPEGQTPIWLPNLVLDGAHLTAFGDPRIMADIARRLRGETPLATEPLEPLPRG